MRESEPARLKPETRATRAHIHAAPISEITRKTGRRSSVRLCDDYTVSSLEAYLPVHSGLLRSDVFCDINLGVPSPRKHPSKAETKAPKQGGNGRANPWKGWRIIAQGERSEPWVVRRHDPKPPNGGDGRGSVFRESFRRLYRGSTDTASLPKPVFYSCFWVGSVSSVSEGFCGGFRACAAKM